MGRSRHIPERTCIACGQKLPKRELIRIVRTPQGTITVDMNGKSAGRGAYLCSAAACWQKGLRRGGLERSLRTPITEPDRAHLMAFYQQHLADAGQPPPLEN